MRISGNAVWNLGVFDCRPRNDGSALSRANYTQPAQHPKLMRIGLPLAIVLLAISTACTKQERSPDQIRQDAANATARLRTDTKAAAEGVREGWKRGELLDINSASREKLAGLPGLDDTIADRIIAHRPYNDTQELLTRRVVSKNDYDRIRDQIEVKK